MIPPKTESARSLAAKRRRAAEHRERDVRAFSRIAADRTLRPIVVCGAQRCGTRFVTDALNAFPEVSLLGEVEPAAFRCAMEFMASVDAVRAEGKIRPKWHQSYLRNRAFMTMTFWLSTQKRPIPEIGPETTYFGYKNPQHERYWRRYEAIFAYTPPIYVHCFRSFPSYWISVKTRWPERSIVDAAKVWQSSAKTFDEMHAVLGDRALSFILDDLVAHGQSYLDAVLRRLPFGQGTLPSIDPSGRRIPSTTRSRAPCWTRWSRAGWSGVP